MIPRSVDPRVVAPAPPGLVESANRPEPSHSVPRGRPLRVGLLGMYASANLGDTAIQQVVMSALRARRPDLEFVGLCTDPEDAARTFGIPARHLSGTGPQFNASHSVGSADGGGSPAGWPLPMALAVSAWRIDRHMRQLDMLLVSGSGQIDDFWGGPWQQPFRLFAWAAAARRQGKPTAFFGVGVDQLLTSWGRRLCRHSLSLAQLRVLRDGGSLDALRALGLQAVCEVAPDPAFHLTGCVPQDGPETGEPGYVVVSPIARQAWPGRGAEQYENYLVALGAVADVLQRRGLELRFVCSQTRMDPPVVELVRSRMRTDRAATRVVPVRSVDDYLREVRGAQLVVGSRLHALILALVAGTPVVAVSYARKVRRQLEDMGLGHQVLDLEGLQVEELLSRVEEALADQVTLRGQIHTRTNEFRRLLDLQFDRVAALMPSPAGESL